MSKKELTNEELGEEIINDFVNIMTGYEIIEGKYVKTEKPSTQLYDHDESHYSRIFHHDRELYENKDIEGTSLSEEFELKDGRKIEGFYNYEVENLNIRFNVMSGIAKNGGDYYDDFYELKRTAVELAGYREEVNYLYGDTVITNSENSLTKNISENKDDFKELINENVTLLNKKQKDSYVFVLSRYGTEDELENFIKESKSEDSEYEINWNMKNKQGLTPYEISNLLNEDEDMTIFIKDLENKQKQEIKKELEEKNVDVQSIKEQREESNSPKTEHRKFLDSIVSELKKDTNIPKQSKKIDNSPNFGM